MATINGTNNSETLTGTSGNDTLKGFGGNDILIGRAGADALFGGDGLDAASYATASAAVRVDLGSPGVNTGDAAGDTYDLIENLIGSPFGDNLAGNSGRILSSAATAPTSCSATTVTTTSRAATSTIPSMAATASISLSGEDGTDS